jgi:putative hydroxymethylpyrimidine transport system ATP-binding protein
MAGRPAVLGPPLQPEGRPARPLDDPALLALQAELLGRLAAARVGNGRKVPAETVP